MTERIPENEQSNYEIFRECVSVPVLKALALPAEKPKKTAKKRKEARVHGKKYSGGGHAGGVEGGIDGGPGGKKITVKETEELEGGLFGEGNDAEDLGDFIEVHSIEIHFLVAKTLRYLTLHS
jgi:hypothetical protein